MGRLWILLLLCLAACGTSSTATLTTTWAQSESGFSTDIVAIDGKAPSRSNLQLEPGRHVVEVVGTSKRTGPNASLPAGVAAIPGGQFAAMVAPLVGASRSPRMKACFSARAGRQYEVRTFEESGGWQIQVIDQSTTYDVKSPCKPTTAAR